MYKYNEIHSINVIPSDCVHGFTLVDHFLLEGLTPFLPQPLYSTGYIGVTESEIVSRRTQYVKLEAMDRPLSVRRTKVWSFKCPFTNQYRGKSYTGSLEFYIYKPHQIDLEQSWYEPVITVRFHSGMDAIAEFTWEQFEQSPFFNMISDTDSLLRTYIRIRNDIGTIRNNKKGDSE